MVDSPTPTVIYTVIYFIIVGLGPRCMKNRKPFKLTPILIPYNILMTLLNLYIAIEVCITVFKWTMVLRSILQFKHLIFSYWWHLVVYTTVMFVNH